MSTLGLTDLIYGYLDPLGFVHLPLKVSDIAPQIDIFESLHVLMHMVAGGRGQRENDTCARRFWGWVWV